MKRKIIMFVSGITVMLAMTGCPYESKVPLSDSCSSSIDPELLGTWVFRKPGNDNDTLDVMKFSDHEYYVETRSAGKKFIKSSTRARAFITNINHNGFINYCEVGNPDEWIFFKYSIHNNLLILLSPSDEYIKQPLQTSEENYQFFLKNLNKEGFYEPVDTAFRIMN
jgi:hypothetical protein